jgi:class 3 adenylate cyclase/tetratricopeptide (TPR) repeat protein
MKCPKCQFENPDDKKFCRECGAKLLLACPQCAAEILPSDKFCGECGNKISIPLEAPPKDLSFDEKLNKIQRYLPKGLTEKILSQKDRIEGERKQVTVMFCDMEGFTQLSERLGPEEAYTVMDQVYEILIHKVHDYEGTVNEFTGDGIMALFGAPIALEDAPQRAIRSAHAIHREMTKFSDKMKQEKENIPALKMRIGIHTGPVVVGTLGNDLRVEFKAVGDTVNLASRMEGLAEPGSTYVTEDTFRLTEGLFRFEVLGEHVVKGRADIVKAYRVIAPSTRRTRFDVGAERGLTPFVGRERELELLLDGFERSKTGRGQAFSIMSEAGVGKSRLLYEFRKAVSNEDVTFMEGKCLSYSRGVAYHPVIDIVKSNFDITESDGDLEIREKLKRGLKVLDTDESSILPYLLGLLSVKDSGVDPISMSPEARMDRIIGALNRIIIKASQIRPLIMAIEDFHWIDKSSEDSLKALLDSISGERIFLIFTYRPEYMHTWGAKSYHSQVNLNRLSNRESLAMVAHLLGTEEIDRQLEELIFEKTEGVPFFIEEFIKSLKDLKIIERTKTAYHLAKDLQEITIPSTIQDVIMARVDTLHDYYGVLAEHFISGEGFENAANYCRLAGKKAEKAGSINDAISYGEKQVVCLEKLPLSDDLEKNLIDARTVLGLYYAQLTMHFDAKEAVDPIFNLVTKKKYKRRLCQILCILGGYYVHINEDISKAIEYLEKAIKIGQEINDLISLVVANTLIGTCLSFNCEFGKALTHYEKSLKINVMAKRLWSISTIKSFIASFVYWPWGKISLGYKTSSEALSIADESGDIFSKAHAHFAHGVIYHAKGYLKKAEQHLLKAADFFKKINSTTLAAFSYLLL